MKYEYKIELFNKKTGLKSIQHRCRTESIEKAREYVAYVEKMLSDEYTYKAYRRPISEWEEME